MSAALDITGPGRGPVADHLPPRSDPVARARAIAPLIAAAAPRIEAGCQLTPDVLDALHGAALFRTLLPRAYGGEEITPAGFVRLQEVIAAADASTAWCLGQASGCSMAAAYMDPAIAREIWGADPRAAVAWGMGHGVAAVAEGGGYRVSGKWRFASGIRHATWVGAHCQVRERDGSLRCDAEGQPIERTMMFRKGQVEITEDWRVVGLRGTGSDTYAVQDAFVPEAYSLQRDLEEERRVHGPLYHFSTTQLYASGFAAVSMGIARAMLDEFRAMAMAKTPAASARPMRDSEVIQNGLAQAEAKLRSARAFLLEVLEESWAAAQARGEVSLDEKVLIRLATTSAIHRAKEVAEWAYHEAGATAIFESQPFERRMRDIHASAQQLQGRSAHLELCGQHFLGKTPQSRFL